MPRKREQLTGHVWLKSLSTDIRNGQATVYRTESAHKSIDTLIAWNLLVLCKLSGNLYYVQCFPRKDKEPPVACRVAASYVAERLDAALQAAVNDYMHLASRIAAPSLDTKEHARPIFFAQGAHE